MRYVSRKILYSLLFAVLVYGGLALYSDLGKVRAGISRFEFVYVLPILSLSLGNYVVRYFRWNWYLRRVGIEIAGRESLKIFMSGLFMSISPGKVGELLKSWLLKDYHGVPVAISSPVVISERVTDFTAIIVLTLVGLSLYVDAIYWVLAGAGFIACFSLVFYSDTVFSVVYGTLVRFKAPEQIVDFFVRARETMRSFLRPSPLAFGTFMGVFAWGFECAGLYLVLSGLGVALSLTQAVFTYSAATLVGALSFLPGGLGATEVSLAALLVRFGIDKGLAATATVLVRLATLWFAVVLGGIFLFGYVKGTPPGEAADRGV